jgi:hypothetical protein
MLIKEILSELHVRSADSQRKVLGMRERLRSILQPLANKPILYRMFDIEVEAPIHYVSNHGRNLSDVRSTDTVASTQEKILQSLGVSNPAFATMHPPYYFKTWGWGDANIIVPPADAKLFWSQNIIDLGSAELSNGKFAKDANELLAAASDYRQGWPDTTKKGEVIVDCSGYYLINLEKLIPEVNHPHMYKQTPKMFSFNSGGLATNMDNWMNHLKTYGDILKFIDALSK